MTTAQLARQATETLRRTAPAPETTSIAWALDQLRAYVAEANAIDAADRFATIER